MPLPSRFRAPFFASLVPLVGLGAACASSSSGSGSTPHFDAGTPEDGQNSRSSQASQGMSSQGASSPGGSSQSLASGSSLVSGTSAVSGAASSSSPTATSGGSASRQAACTPLSQQNGSAVTTSYGRLDGTLVYIVDVGTGQQCNGDDSHVHLQIEVSGSVYDVAVDIGKSGDEVGLYEESITVPGGVWSEGWHGSDALAYGSEQLHSGSFTTTAPDALGAQLATLLAGVSKISVFCKGYSQGNGCHDVHYENGQSDGAIVLSPTATSSKTLFFRFTDQSF